MPSAHAAVKHELLVRYLDAWTPAALHRHKRVTYVEAFADREDTAYASAVAALRVFGEFADLLERHTLTMVLGGTRSGRLDALRRRLIEVAAEYESPAGLVIRAGIGAPVAALREAHALGSPIFGWFDASGPVATDVLSTVAGNKASEVLLALPAGAGGQALGVLRKAGLPLTAQVEIVNAAGVAELLVFATSSEKALEKFKDELWALDEYAGIRLRDPVDEEHTLLDISVQPHLGPLRRALAARVVHTGGSTMAELRVWAVHETVFRAADATKAVQTLVTSGAVSRDPVGGRLSPDTLIQPADRLADVDE